MSTHDHELIRILKTLPPNTVYLIAPKDFVVRGYDYYRREQLASYTWSKDQHTLTASVLGTKLYAVRFTMDDGALTYTCECPAWTPSSNCKHIICALLTTINLLAPNTFKMPGHSLSRLKALEASLLDVHSEEPTSISKTSARSPYEIVISLTKGYPGLYIRKNGKQMVSSWGVPAQLAPLVAYNIYASWSTSENLLAYLAAHGNTYPIILETTEGETPLEWEPDLTYQPKTDIQVVDETVFIRAVCLLDGIIHDQTRPFWNFVADLQSRKLGHLHADTGGWNLYHYLSRLVEFGWDDDDNRTEKDWLQEDLLPWSPFSDEDRLLFARLPKRYTCSLPLREFQRIQINLSWQKRKTMLQHVLLRVQDDICFPQEQQTKRDSSPPQYRLTIKPQTADTHWVTADAPSCILKAERFIGESSESLTIPTFTFFTDLEKSRSLPAALRTQKRKIVLYDTFFQLLRTRKKSEAHRIIHEALSGTDFKQSLLKESAKRLLKRCHATLSDHEVRLVFHDDHWLLIPNDQSKEALLYLIPFELFGLDIFRGMRRHDEMTLSFDALQKQLPQLQAQLQAADIEFFYESKRIVTSKWDFSFDAQRSVGIDWFELRPEIRCDGTLLEQTDWEAAFNQGGMLETPETVQILDLPSYTVLQALSAIYQTSKAQKTGKGEMVHIPRLQILDWIFLRKHGVRVKLCREDEAIIDRLTNFKKIKPTPLPQRLHATLRSYQQDGYHWLVFLYENRFGACLADDMGLGKTIQAISLLAGIREGRITSPPTAQGPHLVVLPPSLLFNWESEITRFYPDLTVRFYTGKGRRPSFEDCDIVLTTYGLVRRDISHLEKIPFHVIIFDEAQAVKNMLAQTTGAVRRLKGSFKLVMTGTPLENHVGEYYSLIDLCLPGLMGEYNEFKSQMKVHISAGMDTILRRTKPFVLRRTKDQILQELPPKIETDIYLELTHQQKAFYKQTVAEIKPTIDEAYRTKTHAQAHIIALTAILKLRQICLSPRLLNPALPHDAPKIECLADRLNELLEEGHSALVFSQFTSFLDLVESTFQAQAIPYARLDGSTPTGKRKGLVKGFQEGQSPSVFLLSLKAGGQGLNLTKASYVFHLDPWWNPAVENQASDRAHRLGQHRTVSIMRLLMRHTIEEKMMELKQQKLTLYQAVMEGSTHSGTSASITKKDFDFLVG